MAKILIVDDDSDLVQSLSAALSQKGHDAVSAPDGAQGLLAVKEENPDLVVLDVMMETGDKGFDVARDIRKDENHKNTPILMLTGLEAVTGMSFKNEAGDKEWLPVDDYVEKPVSPDDLVARIDRLIKK
jgi:DNA-binding response OmpR family regulator